MKFFKIRYFISKIVVKQELSRQNLPVPRRILLVSISILLAVLPVSSASSATNPHNHKIVDTFAEGVGGNSEVYAIPDEIVQKIVSNTSDVNYLQSRQYCDSYTTGACALPTNGVSMRLYLPVCTSAISSLCIEGVEVSDQNSNGLIAGKNLGLVDGKTYAGVPATGLPEGAAPSRWQVPGVKHSGGADNYAVKVLIDAFKTNASKKIWIFSISSIVEPYVESNVKNVLGEISCTSWRIGDTCAKRVDFAEKQRIALTLHLPNTLTGWLNGRLKDSKIAVTPIDAEQNKLRVEADPVLVPEVDVSLTDEQFNSLPNPSFFLTQGQSWNSVNAGNPVALEWIRQLAGVMKDTASGEHSTWAFSSAGNNGGGDCLGDKTRLIGLVTTNAAVYSPGAPDFQDGYLNYQVGGLHYRSDGKTLTLGTYDLLIRSDAARCLYRYTSAPLSATVSVTKESGGTEVVATSMLDEKDGWLHLGAYGFTFSRPILKVKLNGTPQQLLSNNNPKPATTTSKVKDFTFTCVKGKQVKKITAPKIQCPVGWKKK